jgi:hypothetical protein
VFGAAHYMRAKGVKHLPLVPQCWLLKPTAGDGGVDDRGSARFSAGPAGVTSVGVAPADEMAEAPPDLKADPATRRSGRNERGETSPSVRFAVLARSSVPDANKMLNFSGCEQNARRGYGSGEFNRTLGRTGTQELDLLFCQAA